MRRSTPPRGLATTTGFRDANGDDDHTQVLILMAIRGLSSLRASRHSRIIATRTTLRLPRLLRGVPRSPRFPRRRAISVRARPAPGRRPLGLPPGLLESVGAHPLPPVPSRAFIARALLAWYPGSSLHKSREPALRMASASAVRPPRSGGGSLFQSTRRCEDTSGAVPDHLNPSSNGAPGVPNTARNRIVRPPGPAAARPAVYPFLASPKPTA